MFEEEEDLSLEYYRGDSYPSEFTLTNKDTGLPINLTGLTAVMTVDSRSAPDDDTTQLFTVIGVIDADPTSGKCTFQPLVINTTNPVGNYYYDIQLNGANDYVRTVVKDTFVITQDIGKS